MSDRVDPVGGYGPTILREGWVLAGIYSVVLAIRTYVRATMVKDAGAWALIWAYVAYVLGIISTSIATSQVLHGLGNHVEVVKAANPDLSHFLFMKWLYHSFQPTAIPIARFSVAAFLLDLQRNTHHRQRWLMISLVLLGFTLSIVTLFVMWFQCSPPRRLWHPEISGVCPASRGKANYGLAVATGIVGIVTDIFLALYPMYIIRGLQMKRRLKLLISVLMSLGIFSAVCGIERTYQLKIIRTSGDAIYEEGPLYQWAQAEFWVILITSGIPASWPLINQYITKWDMKRRASQPLSGLSSEKPSSSSDQASHDTSKGSRQRLPQAMIGGEAYWSEMDNNTIMVTRDVEVKAERHEGDDGERTEIGLYLERSPDSKPVSRGW